MKKRKSYDVRYIDIMLERLRSIANEPKIPYTQEELDKLPNSLRLQNEIHAEYVKKLEKLKAELPQQEFEKERDRLLEEMADKFFEIDESIE